MTHSLIFFAKQNTIIIVHGVLQTPTRKEADMDKLAVIARISCISGLDQFYAWAIEQDKPTGIEPPMLNEHIKEQVMETLEYLEDIDMPELLN